MKKVFAVCAAVLLFAACAKKEEPKVLFAYFSGYRCPPCMQFKLEYFNDFKKFYKEKYGGRVIVNEYMTDIPLDLTDKDSAEYKSAKEIAARNNDILGATGKMYNVKWIGSIPFAVIGDSVFDGSTPETELNKENVERAIDKALKNHETTKLALKLSGKAEDYSSIVKAASAGDYNAVKAFLDKGADVNQHEIVDGEQGATALTASAFSGNIDIVKLLLERGAKIDIPAGWGSTALDMSAMFGRTDVVELLLSKGADIYAGNNAIVLAAEGTDRNMVRLLKQHGGDVNKKLKDGTTPLMFIVSTRDDGKTKSKTEIAIKSAGILIDEGADVNAKSKDGKTALSYAKSAEMKKFLISKGAK